MVWGFAGAKSLTFFLKLQTLVACFWLTKISSESQGASKR
ncbi:hypothetical protein NSP_37810 [Nodularia spumigena CCY9414]|nr:hypothetical protein NSP_37810 [Nodularia spumigena CCY9414]